MVVIDTNLWIYFLTDQDPNKREVSKKVLKKLTKEGIVIPSQVFKEIAFVLRNKMDFSKSSILEALEIVRKIALVKPESTLTVKLAIELSEKYKLQFWDSLIIAFSLENNIPILLTEDKTYTEITLNGKVIKLINPFETLKPGGQR
jgi:predicted nucleic acid-binding protein